MPLFVRLFTNTAPRSEFERHMEGHLAYLRELVAEGKLRYAGPFADGTGGIEILQMKDRIEAQETMRRDPFVVNGLGVYELREFRDILGDLPQR
ncbi:MAG: hypothetical protein HY608_05125 [Planctomycetes bacterium]|nr:hypothetical protein [Planctomycetota bacterium]